MEDLDLQRLESEFQSSLASLQRAINELKKAVEKNEDKIAELAEQIKTAKNGL